MKKTAGQIIEKVNELWPSESYDHQKVEVSVGKPTTIRISRMYEAPGLSFAQLRALADWFGTDDISDAKFRREGCETCDYGSEYGFTLYVGK